LGYIRTIFLYLFLFSFLLSLDTFKHVKNITSLLNTTSIKLIDSSSILVSSDGGIYRVDLNTFNSSDYTHNLEYIDINSIATYNNQFWLAGNDGNIQILDQSLNLDYIIDYTDFHSIRKIVFYNEYAFAIGTDLEGQDILIQYSISDYPNYLNYIDINNLLNTIPDCNTCPSNDNRIHDINIGDHEIALATTAGFYIADLSNYNHNLLSSALDWSSLFVEETLLIIDNFVYFKYDNQINVGYSGPSEPFSYPASNLDIIGAEYYDGKLYSLFSNVLYISNADGSELQEFYLPDDINSEFKDLLLFDSHIYIGLKNYGIIKVSNDFSDIDYHIIPNTLFSNNITALDINDNHTLAGLSGETKERLGGFIINDVHTISDIKNFYSYGSSPSNYPVSGLNIDNVHYNGKSLSYVSGDIESYGIKFNNKGELYFLNSGVYLDPDNYCYDDYDVEIEYVSSLIQLDPATLEISNAWGEDVFSGKRKIYPDTDTAEDCLGCLTHHRNYTKLTQLFFDDYDNAWIVNPNSEGETNKPISSMINSQEDNWVFIEDHPNSIGCAPSISGDYLLPKEAVLDYDNNLWISYERDTFDVDYSPGGIKMVKINDISTNADDQWYDRNNTAHKIDVFDCDDENNDEPFYDISVFSMDIGKDSYGNTILWILTSSGIMAYRIVYEDSSYKLYSQSVPSFSCNFYLSELYFDSLSKIRVDKQNNAWIISKNGVKVLGSKDPWNVKISLDSETTNLLSNNIQDIAFDDNGYIYFATDKGVSIFRSIFAENQSLSNISLSPNPFMIGTDNSLTITNLTSKSTIHIMNLSGKVVKKFTLDEGNVVLNWDGKGDDGRYLNTGVYLVAGFHASQSQGVTKLAIIRK